MATLPNTRSVTIISIWSKDDSPEAKLAGRRQENTIYAVDVPVAESDEAMLEAAFEITNIGPCPARLKAKACSTTSGDLMIVRGQYYLVEPRGFKALTEAQADQVAQLYTSDTMFGWDWLVKHGLVTA